MTSNTNTIVYTVVAAGTANVNQLEVGVSYTFTVVASNAGNGGNPLTSGASSASNSVMAGITPSTPVITSAVAGTGAAGAGTVLVSFTPSTTSGVGANAVSYSLTGSVWAFYCNGPYEQ